MLQKKNLAKKIKERNINFNYSNSANNELNDGETGKIEINNVYQPLIQINSVIRLPNTQKEVIRPVSRVSKELIYLKHNSQKINLKENFYNFNAKEKK